MTRDLLALMPQGVRDAINLRFPAVSGRMRSALAELKRVRGLDERIRSVEQAAHRRATAEGGIRAWECSTYSQNGEDGILMHVFSRIGSRSCRFLEFGCGNGVECNSNNLALGFGWSGLLLDANQLNVAKARLFLASRPEGGSRRVTVRREVVTPTNINGLIREASGNEGELDLLSIDVDGNDYWIWNAVEGSSPRVVVVEYNASFGPERSVAVAFDQDFDRMQKHPSGYYHGASLEALRRLAASRGYQLIGCDSAGVNAFFVRTDCAGGLPSPTSAEAWVPIRERAKVKLRDQFATISHLPLIDV